MALRITDMARDLPKLNIELSRLDQLQQQINKLQTTVAAHETSIQNSILPTSVTAQNNVVFTWTGSTHTMSWAPGYVKSQAGHYLPVPAGSQVLTASTYYWVAYNPVHQTMSFNPNLDLLHGVPTLLVLCQLYTGTGAQSGSAGGGGTEPGGNRGLNGKQYKLF